MKTNPRTQILLTCLIAIALRLPSPAAGAEWIDGFRNTPMEPGGKWHVHDPDRPQPPVVTPGETFSQNAQAPSDAEMLFDGKDLSKWQAAAGGDAKWHFQDGYVETQRGGGIRTRGKWADFQLHVEFSEPNPPVGTSQGRGNSGILINNMYEVQVLDSYEAKTYADGQCAAIYGQSPPLVNACKPPGQWQTYDIIFESPRWRVGQECHRNGGSPWRKGAELLRADRHGQCDQSSCCNGKAELIKKAIITVIHNGVVVQNHYELIGMTDGINAELPWKSLSKYPAPHAPEVFVELQDHNNPVRFRNIWIRTLNKS